MLIAIFTHLIAFMSGGLLGLIIMALLSAGSRADDNMQSLFDHSQFEEGGKINQRNPRNQ